MFAYSCRVTTHERLLSELRKYDLVTKGSFSYTVRARDRVEACRMIIHQFMPKHPVRKIRIVSKERL